MNEGNVNRMYLLSWLGEEGKHFSSSVYGEAAMIRWFAELTTSDDEVKDLKVLHLNQTSDGLSLIEVKVEYAAATGGSLTNKLILSNY